MNTTAADRIARTDRLTEDLGRRDAPALVYVQPGPDLAATFIWEGLRETAERRAAELRVEIQAASDAWYGSPVGAEVTAERYRDLVAARRAARREGFLAGELTRAEQAERIVAGLAPAV